MHTLEKSKRVIEVTDVSFSYNNEVVLKDISLAVEKGDYLGVVGPNGAGKTTFLKIVLGLLKPTRGLVKLFGEDVEKFKGWAKIGYVPQRLAKFDDNFPATVHEVVLMGRYGRRGLFHRITDQDRHKARVALAEVNMQSFHNRLIGELSGGEQQRVFIARALASEPEIVFLDEPTIGIDQQARDEFYALLKRLNKERHLTLVLVSHDIDMVVRESGHIACLDRELVCHGLPKDFLADSLSTALFQKRVKIITHTHQH